MMKPNKKELEDIFKMLLSKLGVDLGDENYKDTPERLSRMYVDELFRGMYEDEPNVPTFPSEGSSNVFVKSPMTSLCPHHLQPVNGSVYIGVKYEKGSRVIGLSKFSRLVSYISSKPILQEDLTHVIHEKIVEKTNAKNVCVLVKVRHGCIGNRGVCDTQNMTTTVLLSEDSNFNEMFYRSIEK